MKTYPPGHPVSVVVVPDDYHPYDCNNFCIPPKYKNYIDSLMLTNGLIKDRIEKVASEIVEYFEKNNIQSITVICVLKGGFRFCTDLIDAMERIIRARDTPIPIITDFVRIRTFVNDKAGPTLTLNGVEDPEGYRGKDILIVDDIIDSGRSMQRLHDYLHSLNVKSVTDVTLLVKRTPHSNGYRPRFAGFEIPNQFVIGYALDYNDYFRDLTHVCLINQAGLEHFAVPENQ